MPHAYRQPRSAHRTFPALVSLLLIAASPAWAGDQRIQTLPLKNGKSLEGVVERATPTDVVLRIGKGDTARTREIPWTQLAPLGVYRARAAVAPPADGEARKLLAEMAADLGLYVEARAEYEKAWALGALDEKSFRTLVRAAERHAVEAGIAQALKLAEAGDLERALAKATELRIHFRDAPNAKDVIKLVDQLLEQVTKMNDEAQAERQALEAAMVDLEKNKEILRRRAQASKALAKASSAAALSKKARDVGNVTRARKNADIAHKHFQEARRHYGRLRRVLPRGHTMRRDTLGRLVELDKQQFDLLFGMAWFLWQGRVYSQAEIWASRASYIDPVHPDLMDLRADLVASRIRYRLSDVSNARGIVR